MKITRQFITLLFTPFLVLLLLGATMHLRAAEVMFKNGYSEMIADPENIDEVRMKVGFKTLLLFPSDEKIVRVEVGIRGTVLEIKYGVNWVTLRPSEEKLATNLHVATDKGRVYSFDLVEGTLKTAHRKIVVLRPDMDLDPDGGPAIPAQSSANQIPIRPATPAAQPTAATMTASGRKVTIDGLEAHSDKAGPSPINTSVAAGGKNVPGMEIVRKLDNDYTIKNGNSKIFSVDQVSNDGERSFVRFKSRLNEAPLFYVVNAQGKREVLTYRLEAGSDPRDPDLFVIPRLFDKATVKVGDTESHISWNAVK